MAAKKWPKWLIGISSVVSFTGFLYVAQGHQSGGKPQEIADPAADNVNSSSTNLEDIRSIPLSANTDQQYGQDSASTIKMFIHSRAEFTEIENLSEEGKAEREKQLEQLDWDSSGGNMADLPSAPITTPSADKSASTKVPSAGKTDSVKKSVVAQAPKPTPSTITKAPTPAPTPSAIVQAPKPTPVFRTRSDRRSRRS